MQPRVFCCCCNSRLSANDTNERLTVVESHSRGSHTVVEVLGANYFSPDLEHYFLGILNPLAKPWEK